METEKFKLKITFLCVLLVVLVSVPYFGIPEYALSVFIAVFIYCSLCVSWNVVGGYTGYLSFGHAAFFGFGAYVSALLYTHTGMPPYGAILLAGIFSSILATGIGYPCLKVKGPYFAVVTFATVPMLKIMFENLEFTGGVQGIFIKSSFNTPTIYLITLCLMVLSALMAVLIEKSAIGIGFTSIREDEDAAETIGINTSKIKTLAFALSAFFPGMVGGVFSFYKLYINPSTVFSEEMSILIVLFSLFGGTMRWIGPIIGASILVTIDRVLHIYSGIIIDWLEYLPYFKKVFPYFSSGILASVLFGLILILVIIFMPKGILGWLEKIELERLKKRTSGRD